MPTIIFSVVLGLIGVVDLVEIPKWYGQFESFQAEPLSENVNDALVKLKLQHPDKIAQRAMQDIENVTYFLSDDGIRVNEIDRLKLIELFLKKSLVIQDFNAKAFESLFNCNLMFSGDLSKNQNIVYKAIEVHEKYLSKNVAESYTDAINDFLVKSFYESDFTDDGDGFTLFILIVEGDSSLFYRIICNNELFEINALVY